MNFRILKRDLKRKRSINVILLVFIFLSTMFIAGSLNNFAVVTTGVDYFLEQSGIGDFLIVTMGGEPGEPSENDKSIEEFLKGQEQVERFTVDENLLFSENQIKLGNGKKIALGNTAVLSSFDIRQQKFYDKENREITEMEDGTIYLGQKLEPKGQVKVGDTLAVCTEQGYRKEFKVAGFIKDAFLGSEMMGAHRFVVSAGDFQELLEESGLLYGRIYSVECKDTDAFQAGYNQRGFSEMFSAGKALVRTTYVMEMVIAAVILLVSLCLIVISVIMLRFTIIFTVNEDYKEIGIMKAIGIQDASIRKLYMAKYFVLAAAGSFGGFFASIPFSQVLLAQVTEKIIVEKGGSGILLQMSVSILIVLVVVLFGYLSTGKIKKFSPMDAIRSGNNGERFRKKTLFRLKNAHVSATTFLACNDVLSEWKKYFVLLLTSMIGVWLAVMPINTINTLDSDGIAAWFALSECDFYLREEETVARLISEGTKDAWLQYLSETKERLREGGIPVESIHTEVYFNLPVRHGEKSYKSFSIQGIGTSTDQYFYDEGEPPIYGNEVAMTHMVAEQIGAGIGDTVYITIGAEEQPYVITAFYQSMNNMGEGIRFTEQADLDYAGTAGGFGAQIVLENGQDEEAVLAAMRKAEKIFPKAEAQTTKEFINSMIGGISGRLGPLKLLVLALVLAINVLVAVLMQKMFLIRERGELGMLKSIGFSNGALVGWQAKRGMLVLFLGIALGTLTGTPFSEVTSGKVFQMMGAEKIEFVVNPLEIYLLYPAMLFAAITLACTIAMRRIKKVSVQEMDHIE